MVRRVGFVGAVCAVVGLAAAGGLASGGAAAQVAGADREPNGRPTKPPGWYHEAAAGDSEPALFYDVCPGCHDETWWPVVARCKAGGGGMLELRLPDPGYRGQQLIGRVVSVELTVGSWRQTLRAKVEETMGGTMVQRPVRPDDALFDALSSGAQLVVAGPMGADRFALRGAGQAVDGWRRACRGPQAAEDPLPARVGRATVGPFAPSDSLAPVAPAGPAALEPSRERPGGWGSLQGEGSGGRLSRFVGTYDQRGFFADPAVAGPLAAMLGAQGMRRLRDNLQVAGAMERVGGMVVLRGLAPHQGGDEEAIVAVSPGGEVVEAGLLSGGRVTVFGGQGREALGQAVLGWARERSRQGGFAYRELGVR